MEGNKDEANRCIQIAERYIQEKNREKAEKFLHKAERLFPTQKAKDLLEQLNFLAPKTVEKEQPRKRKISPSSRVEEVEKPPPEYTPEQEQAVKRIQKCKDYYEILGVSKDATDSEIKKQYKKLALQMHPDKNKCPGASEAFKSLGNAVAVLTDAEKRKNYDLYGSNEERLANRSHHTHTYETDFTAEEMFNMFFGSGLNGSNIYYRRGNRWQRHTATTQSESRQQSRQREQQNTFSVFIQLLPILLAIVLSMASSFFISDPAYSLQSTQKYSVVRKTQNLGIPYYVKTNFHTEYQGSVRRLEQSVEEEYITNLRHACYREKNYRDSMIWKARHFGDRELFQSAQNIKVPSCEQLQNIRSHG